MQILFCAKVRRAFQFSHNFFSFLVIYDAKTHDKCAAILHRKNIGNIFRVCKCFPVFMFDR